MLAALTVAAGAAVALRRPHRTPLDPPLAGAARARPPASSGCAGHTRSPATRGAGVIAGLAIMLGLAIPALSLRAGPATPATTPASLTTRQAYDLIARGFGAGDNGPLSIVVALPTRDDTAAVGRVAARAARRRRDIAVGLPGAAQPGGHDRAARRLSPLLAAVGGDDQARSTICATTCSRACSEPPHDDPGRRRQRVGDRLQPRPVEQAAAVHRDRPAPVSDPARARVPLAGRSRSRPRR